MLVLSRLSSQVIVIETQIGPIEITVVHIGKDKTKLGIEAPPEYNIYRKELREKKN